MAKLKIKEGSLILELWIEKPPGSGKWSCKWSQTFEEAVYDGLEIEIDERQPNQPNRYRKGKAHKNGNQLTIYK